MKETTLAGAIFLASAALGTVTYEIVVTAGGERSISLDASALDRLDHLRQPGESYSDVILRLGEAER
jgi:hypothetical protein